MVHQELPTVYYAGCVIFADVKTEGAVHQKIAHEALMELKVDELGLEQLDREYLSMMTQKFGGGPVGLDTLSTAIGEERGTLEDMVEPYLIQQGFYYAYTAWTQCDQSCLFSFRIEKS